MHLIEPSQFGGLLIPRRSKISKLISNKFGMYSGVQQLPTLQIKLEIWKNQCGYESNLNLESSLKR